MILSTWKVSIIVAAVVFIFAVTSILWLRFGKKGREKFGEPKTVEEKLKNAKLELINIEKEVKKLKERLKNVDEVNSILRIKEEIKYQEKLKVRYTREIKNIEKK